MRRRTLPALIAALLASGAAVHAPAGGGSRGGATSVQAEDAVFFSMQIADEGGVVLAEPMLLGRSGLPLQMELVDPGAAREPQMSLRLQPASRSDGSFDIDFELSVQGRLDRGRGSLVLRSGEEKSARLHYPGGHLDLLLAAFAVPSVEFDLFMEHGRQRQQRTRRI